jgi:hypothetical protein
MRNEYSDAIPLSPFLKPVNSPIAVKTSLEQETNWNDVTLYSVIALMLHNVVEIYIGELLIPHCVKMYQMSTLNLQQN